MPKIKVALLHLLPIAGEIGYNQKLLEKAVRQAGKQNVDWIITPELVTSGLQFSSKIGTDWIQAQPDEWMTNFFTLVQSVNANVFLGCPEKSADGELYNSVFVINRQGKLLGRQRKITSITDDWSSAGTVIQTFQLEDVQVGILICADAYTKSIAETFVKDGAEIIVAPSAWGPGLYGPNGEWEQRSIDTGLPLFVCNRTGEDESVYFWEAESLVLKNGKRLLAHQSLHSRILTFEWDLEKKDLISTSFTVESLESESLAKSTLFS